MSRNGASSMSRRMKENRSGAKSSIGLTCCTPALLTRMSTSMRASASAPRSERSTCHASPPISAASASADARSTSATVTRAPAEASSRAQAAPMPLAPPVTSALRPCRSVMSYSFAYQAAAARAASASSMACSEMPFVSRNDTTAMAVTTQAMTM